MARLYSGVWRPKNAILGMELAGEVEAIGADVTRLAVGDRWWAHRCGQPIGRHPAQGVL